jgi:peroxin-19
MHTESLTFMPHISHSRCRQYDGLQGLINVYETEPYNSERLFELMKEVQEFGLPPSDIVADIAPDLSLDEDGVPQLKSLQDCSVM